MSRVTSVLLGAGMILILSMVTAVTVQAAPNWVVNGKFLALNAEAHNYTISGELTFGPFNFGGVQTEFTCKSAQTNTLIGGDATTNGTDEVTAFGFSKCVVLKPNPASCTITSFSVLTKPWKSELTSSGPPATDEVKAVEFHEVTFGGGAECALNGQKFRTASKNYSFTITNLADGNIAMKLNAGTKVTFENEATKETAEGTVSGSEEMTPPSKSETVAVCPDM